MSGPQRLRPVKGNNVILFYYRGSDSIEDTFGEIIATRGQFYVIRLHKTGLLVEVKRGSFRLTNRGRHHRRS